MKRQAINIENNHELYEQFMELMREKQQDKSTIGADMRHEKQENHIEIK